MKTIISSLLFLCLSSSIFAQDYLMLVPYRKGELWGYADRTGKIIIPCQFQKAKCFEKNGLAIVETEKGNTLIDSKGKQLFAGLPITLIESNNDIYTTIGNNDEGKIVWGYMDKMGNKIGEEYESVSKFYEGLARVQKNGKYGFINQQGVLVIACKYNFAFDFSEGLACVQKSKRYGAIDKTGKIIIPFHYTRLFPFKNGFAQIGGKLKITSWEEPSDDDTFSVGATISVMDTPDLKFIDKKNNLYQMGDYSKIPVELQNQLYPDGMARNFITSPQTVYYQNAKNEYIVKGKYYYGEFFNEGLAAVTIKNGTENLCGFIDKTGKEVVKPQYEDVKDFYNGFACVQKNGLWGFIDKTGKLVIPCQFSDYGYFIHGAAWVEKNGKNALIDTNGKFLIEPTLGYGNRFHQETLGLIQVNEGFIDMKGRKYWED